MPDANDRIYDVSDGLVEALVGATSAVEASDP